MSLGSSHLVEEIRQTNLYTLMFTSALFTIAKKWKQLNCPSTDEWISKM